MKTFSLSLVILPATFSWRREDIPTVKTSEFIYVTSISATCGGEVMDDGRSAVVSKGICWSRTSYPTVNDSITMDGSGLGQFSSYLSDLAPGTQYFFRAYATNNKGTGSGETKFFCKQELGVQ